MPLLPCHECGAEISDSALACPRCGARTRRAQSRSGRWLAVLAIGVLAVGGFALYYNSDAARENREATRALENFRSSDEGVMIAWRAGWQLDSAVAARVRMLSTGDVARCRSLGSIETTGDVMDTDQETRAIRLRSMAAQKGANAILMTTPPEWPARVRGQMYACPP